MKKHNKHSPSRVSLLHIDLLLQGELTEDEAVRVRAEISRSPILQAYFDKASELRSGLTFDLVNASLKKNPSREPHGRIGSRGAFFDALIGFFTGRLPATIRRPAYLTAGVFAAIFLAVSVTYLARMPHKPSDYTAKGLAEIEMVLSLRGSEYQPGEPVAAANGDTLTFMYKSPESLFIKMWCREDDKKPAPLFSGPLLHWEAASSLRPAPQQVILEGKWSFQEIIILSSPKRFTDRMARSVVRNNKGKGAVNLIRFRLVRTNRSPS